MKNKFFIIAMMYVLICCSLVWADIDYNSDTKLMNYDNSVAGYFWEGIVAGEKTTGYSENVVLPSVFSVSMWLSISYHPNMIDDNKAVIYSYGEGTTDKFGLTYGSDGILRAFVIEDGSVYQATYDMTNADEPFTDGSYHNIIAVYDFVNAAIKLYVDNEAGTPISETGPWDNPVSGTLKLGYTSDETDTGDVYGTTVPTELLGINGFINSFTIYNGDIYNESQAIDTGYLPSNIRIYDLNMGSNTPVEINPVNVIFDLKENFTYDADGTNIIKITTAIDDLSTVQSLFKRNYVLSFYDESNVYGYAYSTSVTSDGSSGSDYYYAITMNNCKHITDAQVITAATGKVEACFNNLFFNYNAELNNLLCYKSKDADIDFSISASAPLHGSYSFLASNMEASDETLVLRVDDQYNIQSLFADGTIEKDRWTPASPFYSYIGFDDLKELEPYYRSGNQYILDPDLTYITNGSQTHYGFSTSGYRGNTEMWHSEYSQPVPMNVYWYDVWEGITKNSVYDYLQTGSNTQGQAAGDLLVIDQNQVEHHLVSDGQITGDIYTLGRPTPDVEGSAYQDITLTSGNYYAVFKFTESKRSQGNNDGIYLRAYDTTSNDTIFSFPNPYNIFGLGSDTIKYFNKNWSSFIPFELTDAATIKILMKGMSDTYTETTMWQAATLDFCGIVRTRPKIQNYYWEEHNTTSGDIFGAGSFANHSGYDYDDTREGLYHSLRVYNNTYYPALYMSGIDPADSPTTPVPADGDHFDVTMPYENRVLKFIYNADADVPIDICRVYSDIYEGGNITDTLLLLKNDYVMSFMYDSDVTSELQIKLTLNDSTIKFDDVQLIHSPLFNGSFQKFETIDGDFGPNYWYKKGSITNTQINTGFGLGLGLGDEDNYLYQVFYLGEDEYEIGIDVDAGAAQIKVFGGDDYDDNDVEKLVSTEQYVTINGGYDCAGLFNWHDSNNIEWKLLHNKNVIQGKYKFNISGYKHAKIVLYGTDADWGGADIRTVWAIPTESNYTFTSSQKTHVRNPINIINRRTK